MSLNDSKKRSSQPPSVQNTVQTEQKGLSSSSSSSTIPKNSDASFSDAAKRYKSMPETSVSVIQSEEKELIAAISKLKSYITNSSFSSNVDQRDRHSLIKGTLASFGRIGEDVKKLNSSSRNTTG
jgi:argininosuccinate lyase